MTKDYFWPLRKILMNSRLVTKNAKEKVKRGETPKFGLSKTEVHNKWKNYEKGNPGRMVKEYTKDEERSEFLYEQIKSFNLVRTKSEPILEIGCNVGRNLNVLYKKGFHNLYGIEISPDAIESMKKLYPEMYSNSTLIVGPVEETIKEIEDDKFPLTFTMAILMHIHPKSNFIFDEISRISSDYIITVEDEDTYGAGGGLFPRDYGIIFSKLGWKNLLTKPVDRSELAKLKVTIRIFQKKKK